MKKIYLPFLAVLISSLNSYAQPAIQWQWSQGGSGDEFASIVKPTPDGGYIYSSTSNSTNGDVTGNHGNFDMWVVKTDSAGNIEWEKSLGGTGDDENRDLIVTPDGNYLVVGFTYSNDGDVTGHHGTAANSDIWVVELDTLGAILWSRCYGGSNDEEIIAFNISSPTSDGGYLVTSNTNSTDGDVTGFHVSADPSAKDFWIMKIDSNGTLLWQKCLGGTDHDDRCTTRQTPDGGYIVGGTIHGTRDGDVIGNTDTSMTAQSIWVVKMDSSRTIQWQHFYGGSRKDYFESLRMTSDGGYILGCTTESEDGNITNQHGHNYAGDLWIVKTDSLGTIQWQKCYGGSGNEFLSDLLVLPGGGYLFSGGSADFSGAIDGDITQRHGNFDAWVVKVDSAGTLLWQHNYGGTEDDGLGAFALTPDGGFIFPCSSASNNDDVSGHHGPLTTHDVWLVKFSSVVTGIREPLSPLHELSVFPNPAADLVTLTFESDRPEIVAVNMLDITGRKIDVLLEKNTGLGHAVYTWNTSAGGRPLANGIYIVQVTAGTYSASAKVCINR